MPPKPRADTDADDTLPAAPGSVTPADDALGDALLDAITAVARARVLLSEATRPERAAYAKRHATLLREAKALPDAVPERAPVGFAATRRRKT